MILSFLAGFIVGSIFKFLNMPIPAPTKIEGILGIIGLFVGYYIFDHIKDFTTWLFLDSDVE